MQLARLVYGFSLLITCVLASSPQAYSAERAGVNLPDQITNSSGQELRLNGVGVREYGIFGIDIYVAGLYLASPENSFEAVLENDNPVVILMHYVQGGGDADDVREFWLKYLRANCKALGCTWPEKAVSQFLSLLLPARKDVRERYEFVDGQLSYFLGDERIGSVQDSVLCDLVIASWIGPVPSTIALRDAMLGKRR